MSIFFVSYNILQPFGLFVYSGCSRLMVHTWYEIRLQKLLDIQRRMFSYFFSVKVRGGGGEEGSKTLPMHLECQFPIPSLHCRGHSHRHLPKIPSVVVVGVNGPHLFWHYKQFLPLFVINTSVFPVMTYLKKSTINKYYFDHNSSNN